MPDTIERFLEVDESMIELLLVCYRVPKDVGSTPERHEEHVTSLTSSTDWSAADDVTMTSEMTHCDILWPTTKTSCRRRNAATRRRGGCRHWPTISAGRRRASTRLIRSRGIYRWKFQTPGPSRRQLLTTQMKARQFATDDFCRSTHQ